MLEYVVNMAVTPYKRRIEKSNVELCYSKGTPTFYSRKVLDIYAQTRLASDVGQQYPDGRQ